MKTKNDSGHLRLQVDPSARGLIFDLDGTIADSMPVHFIAYQHILSEYGIHFTPEVFETMAGMPAVGTIFKINEIYGTRFDPEQTGMAKEAEYERLMHLIEPIEPVVSLIREYQGRIPMAVGTGGYKRLAWKTLEILGLRDCFTVLVSSEDVTRHKPFPDTFLKCADLMGIKPEHCQVFEDSALGIEAALTAGMMAVDVTRFYKVTTGKKL